MNAFSKLIICIIAIASAGILTAAAQDTLQYDFSSVSINGLDTYKIYTREQITDALGEPDEEDNVIYNYLVYRTTMVMAPASGDFSLSDVKAARKVSDGIGYDYIGNDSVKICVFTLNSDRFAVNDYIRVGDPVSKVYDMGGKTLMEEDRSRIYWAPEGSPDEPWIEWDCYPAFYYDNNAFSKLIICIIAIASAGIPTAAGRISNLFSTTF